MTPLLIPGELLEAYRWLDGTRLGVVGGAIVGYVLFDGVVYAWHRSVHNVGFLWRDFHPFHHSPRRVDRRRNVVALTSDKGGPCAMARIAG